MDISVGDLDADTTENIFFQYFTASNSDLKTY